MSYIEKEKVLEQFKSLEQLARKRVYDTPTNSPAYERYSTQYYEREKALSIIKAQPTADVEEVRHGYWIQTSEPKFIEGIKRIGVECSVCKIRRNIPAVENHGYYYCPECGAYMRGTNNGEE